jgi:hypothetical protein
MKRSTWNTPNVWMWATIVLGFCALWFATHGCGGVTPAQRTVIHGTLGGLHGACAAVDVDNETWRHICDAVDKSLPFLGQLGAGDAELPPDVAARPVAIVIEE